MESLRQAKRASRAGNGEQALGTPGYQPPYRWAGIVALGIFILYVITLAPTTAFWDTSEYIATAHIVGIPHPPGNPVFILLARTWELLLAPLPVSTAVKINLFSAANGAAAAGFWFLVVHRVLAFFSEDETFRRVGSATAVLISATAFTVWNQSVVNEKVYTVSLMTIALLTWLIFRWRDNLRRGKDDNLLILIVFLLALSLGNHLMAFLVAPAMFLYVIWVHPRALIRWQIYAFAALAWVLGLSAQLFLPIRAESRPVISEADPRCESLIDATIDIVRLHPPVSLLGPDKQDDRCRALAESLRREQYRKPPLDMNPITYPLQRVPRDFKLIKWQFINYAQYFDWQWARSLDGSNTFFAALRMPFTLLFVFLGIYGLLRHYQEDRMSWIYFAVLFATVWIGLVIYLNFKYGYSVNVRVMDPRTGQMVPAPNTWREVRERDYFFIVSFSVWGLWAGVGLAALWQRLARQVSGGSRKLALSHYRRASPILVLALLPLLLNWKYASRAGDYAARDWAYNLLMSIEPYGIVFTNGDNDTFPLWYLQEAEGLRRDVTVIVYSYLATPWYAKQLRDLTRPCGDLDPLSDPTVIKCQRPFEPEEAIAMYQDRAWPPPTRSILDLNDSEIESIPDCYPLNNAGQCMVFPDTMAVSIGEDVQGLVAQGDYLLLNDILVLRILQESAGDRPIYFASTTGTYEKFALQPWMVREGVAYVLSPTDIQPSENIVPVPPSARMAGGRIFPFWVNVDKTRLLLDEYYIYRDMPEWTFWPDLSTNGIPLQYYQAYVTLAQVYLMLNEPGDSNAAMEEAQKYLEVAIGPVELPAAPPPAAEPTADNPSLPIELPTDTQEDPDSDIRP
jgi:hypothetical protein